MTNEQLNGVFRALTDPTRRAVLARLAMGPASVRELARPFAMALPSFLQHLSVLEGCGLVRSEKQGRVRMVRIEAKRLRAAEDWLAVQRAVWERRLDALDGFLQTIKENGDGD